MTAALDAMVKAMAAELVKTSKQEHMKGMVVEHPRFEGRPETIYVDGWFDLEKVARAGLAAIKIPPESVADPTYDAFDWGPPGYDEAPQGSATPKSVFGFMVDKILE